MTGRNHSARSGSEAARSGGVAPPLRSVAFVSSLRRWGGGEKWMLHAAAVMRERGHRVVLAAQPGSELAGRAALAGVPVQTLRLGGWLDPRSLAGLARILAAAGAEVICANLDKEIRQARLAALLARRPVHLVARRGSPVPIKDTWHYRLVYRHGVDRLICNARALVAPVCDAAPWFPRDRVRVIPNAVDAAALRAEASAEAVARVRRELGLAPAPAGPPGAGHDGSPAGAPAGPVIACVGEVGWRKGQEHVLTAAVQLRARFPRAVWLIAGEGDGRAALEDRARQLRILAGDDPAAGGVRFLGFRRDVPALLAASDLLVLPSRSEGFPNTLLEGMALGLPVAASTADGIGELVVPGETGLLHPVDDVPHFVDDVATLLADPDLRQRLGAAARERAERVFGEDAIMDQVEAALAAWPQGHGSGRA